MQLFYTIKVRDFMKRKKGMEAIEEIKLPDLKMNIKQDIKKFKKAETGKR